MISAKILIIVFSLTANKSVISKIDSFFYLPDWLPIAEYDDTQGAS